MRKVTKRATAEFERVKREASAAFRDILDDRAGGDYEKAMNLAKKTTVSMHINGTVNARLINDLMYLANQELDTQKYGYQTDKRHFAKSDPELFHYAEKRLGVAYIILNIVQKYSKVYKWTQDPDSELESVGESASVDVRRTVATDSVVLVCIDEEMVSFSPRFADTPEQLAREFIRQASVDSDSALNWLESNAYIVEAREPKESIDHATPKFQWDVDELKGAVGEGSVYKSAAVQYGKPSSLLYSLDFARGLDRRNAHIQVQIYTGDGVSRERLRCESTLLVGGNRVDSGECMLAKSGRGIQTVEQAAYLVQMQLQGLSGIFTHIESEIRREIKGKMGAEFNTSSLILALAYNKVSYVAKIGDYIHRELSTQHFS